jgi:hypothetical protein
MATGTLVHPRSGTRIPVTVISRNPFTVKPTWDHPNPNKLAGMVNVSYPDPASGEDVQINWLPVNLGNDQPFEFVEISEIDYANLETTGSDPAETPRYTAWLGVTWPPR